MAKINDIMNDINNMYDIMNDINDLILIFLNILNADAVLFVISDKI